MNEKNTPVSTVSTVEAPATLEPPTTTPPQDKAAAKKPRKQKRNTAESKLLNYLAENGPLKGGDIADALEKDPFSIKRTTTINYLTQFTKKGMIQRTGSRRHYLYSVVGVDEE